MNIININIYIYGNISTISKIVLTYKGFKIFIYFISNYIKNIAIYFTNLIE